MNKNYQIIGEKMDFQKNRGMIILIVALILAIILTFYVGIVNPIILGLGILAIIVMKHGEFKIPLRYHIA